jgi:hypothetical protein
VVAKDQVATLARASAAYRGSPTFCSEIAMFKGLNSRLAMPKGFWYRVALNKQCCILKFVIIMARTGETMMGFCLESDSKCCGCALGYAFSICA